MLTHGFVLDEQGRKMSKSLGNTLAPQVIAEKNGADILRLWAASSDFTEDLRIGQDIIKANVEAYRRLRNTIRFMLANLVGLRREGAHRPSTRCRSWNASCWRGWPSWMRMVREGLCRISISTASPPPCSISAPTICRPSISTSARTRFIATPQPAPRRRAARTVMDEIFRRVVTWFAPILCFTMEEAWLSRFPAKSESVHLQTSSRCPPAWTNPGLIEKWKRIRELRRVVTGALEMERAAKMIGSSLEAAPALYVDRCSRRGDPALDSL